MGLRQISFRLSIRALILVRVRPMKEWYLLLILVMSKVPNEEKSLIMEKKLN